MLDQRKQYITDRKKELINGRKSVVRFSNQICYETQNKEEEVVVKKTKEDNIDSNDKMEEATTPEENPDTRYQSKPESCSRDKI